MENKRPFKTIYTCFPQGKHKVLTMSYDDGKIFDRKLIEIFNKYGIKGTFHLNTGIMPVDEDRIQLSEVKELYKGHEVSCHTSNLLPACGIEYSRVVGSTDDFAFPDNFLEWKSTCHHGHNLMQNAERFADLHKTQYLYMMYVWGHSYEFDRDNSWDLIEGFCKFIGGRDDIWYATNIEIVDYMNAAKNLKYTAKGDKVYNPNAISVWIEVDGQHYEIKPGELKEI